MTEASPVRRLSGRVTVVLAATVWATTAWIVWWSVSNGRREQLLHAGLFLGAAPLVGRNPVDGWVWRAGWGLAAAAVVALLVAVACRRGWWLHWRQRWVVVAAAAGAMLFATFLALTDGAGHEYGPHGDGLVDALTETDLRIGRVLALLDEQGLFEQTLFVVSADHGMAPQDTALRANPAAHVRAVGIAAEVAEPLIWLHDVAVVAERAADLRTGRVIVAHNDVDSSGERPACSGAHVTVLHQPPGAPAHQLAVGVTDHNGRFGFATPSDIASEHLVAHVQAEGRNERRLRFDGHAEIFDAAAALYGT